MATNDKILTSGSMTYTGEEGYTAPGVASGGNRPILLPRNGAAQGVVVSAHLAPGKSDPKVTNLVVKTSLKPIDDKDPIVEGTTINSWDMISGAYSDKAKKAGQPRIHVLRDFLIACGVNKAAVIKLIPVGKGKLDFKKIHGILQKVVGKTVYLNVLDEEGTGKYRGQYTSSITSWVDPEEFEKTVPVAGYSNPLRPAAQRYFDNPVVASKGASDGFDDADDEFADDDAADDFEEPEDEAEAADDDDGDLFSDED
jgi:hypothetical protein